MSSMIEPEYADLYSAWQKAPAPASASALLKGLHPAIESTVRTHIGDTNPLAISRARQMAVKALPSYDPNKASMRTFLFGQLQGIKRYHRNQGQAVRVPERLAFDRQALSGYEKELEHEFNRSPTDSEIADRYGISMRRIAKLRENAPAVAEGTLERSSGQVFGPTQAAGPEQHGLWHDVVYDQLAPTDQLVMQWTLGYNGHRRLSNQEIARKLRVTPGAVSQRKAKIQAMLDEGYLLNEM